MRISALSFIVLAILALSARAEASRQYYLVGLRHIYKMSAYPDPYQSDREAVEETFASAVEEAQKQYDQDMQSIATEEAQDNNAVHQDDRDAVQANLEDDTAKAADRRDESLSQMYTLDDQVREKHPELAVDEDGPYQVMGVDCPEPDQFTNIVFYRPYTLYVGACPYGWNYGVTYTYPAFIIVERRCHTTWISMGCPVFGSMCFNGVRFEVYAPMRREVIFSRRTWGGNHPPRFTQAERVVFNRNRQIQAQKGIIHVHTYQTVIPGITNRGPVHTSGPVKTGAQGQSGSGRPGSGSTIVRSTSHSPITSSNQNRSGQNQSGTGSNLRNGGRTGNSSNNNVIPPIRIIGGYHPSGGGSSDYGNRNSGGGTSSSGGTSNGGGSTYRFGNSGTSNNGGSASNGGSTGRYGNGSSNNGGSGYRSGNNGSANNGNRNNGSGSNAGNSGYRAGGTGSNNGSRYNGGQGGGSNNSGSGYRAGGAGSNNGNRNNGGQGSNSNNSGSGSRSGGVSSNGNRSNGGGSQAGGANSGAGTGSHSGGPVNAGGSSGSSGSSSNNNGNKKNGR